ncbi:MAG: tetratricopeptide repeat protein [Bacteroidota bacterium]|nr:tetratricopeptide repeat protein [Bacteroidota bacterium]
MKILSLLVIIAISLDFAFAQHPLLDQKSTQFSVIDEARQLNDAGLFQKAQWLLEDYLRALPQSENRIEALGLLVQSFIEQEKFEDAYQTSEELFHQKVSGNQYLTTLFYYGLAAYNSARFKPAVKSFKELIKSDSKNIFTGAAYYWKAASEYELDNLIDAESDVQNAFEFYNANFLTRKSIGKDDVLFLWARVYEKQNAINPAIEQLLKLTTDYPSSELMTDTRIRLAALYIRTQRYGSAIEQLNTVTTLTTKQKNAWLFFFAEAEYYIGSYRNAQKYYTELLRYFPFGVYARQARYGLAWSYLKANDYANALKEFRTISLGADSLAQNALYQIGTISVLTDSTAAAVEAFEKLIEKFPYDDYADNAYYLIGMIRYRATQFHEARRQFQIASRLFPKSEIRAEAYRMLGEASLRVGDLSNAQFAFAQVQKYSASDTLTAAALLQEGIALYHLGRFSSSVENFSEFIRKFTRHQLIAEAYLWRGEALYQAAKFEDAENAFSTAINILSSKHPKQTDALYGFSWSLFEQKKFRQAISAFDRFIKDNPNSNLVIEASLRKADCYFFLREYDKASQIYSSLVDDHKYPRLAEYAAFQLGLSFIQRGDIKRGIEHLRRFLLRFPNSLFVEVAQFNIGWAFFSNEQFTLANDEFSIFETNYPESQLMPRVLLNKGDAFYNLATYDSARIYYERVIKDYPKSLLRPDAINGLQFTYQAQGKSAEALAAIDAIISDQSEAGGTDELLLRKGDILFSQGSFGQAAIEYLKILNLQTNQTVRAKALFQLGRSFEFENNHKKAIEYFERVYTENPESEHAPSSILAIGYLQQKMKQWRESLTQFKNLAERYTNSNLIWEAQYNVGISLLNLKETANARKEFDKIIAQAPVNDFFAHRSRLQIARMLQIQKQYNASNDTLTIIITRLSDDIAVEALLLMGENYLLLKRPKDALEAFNQVVEGFAQYPALLERALLGTGECYERLNDRTKAREAYQQIINNPVDSIVKKDAEDRLRRLRR